MLRQGEQQRGRVSGQRQMTSPDLPERLRERLQERRAEIEEAICRRAWEIDDPLEAADSTYAEGVRAAVRISIDCGLAVIEEGVEPSLPVPLPLLAQARLAARNDVPLDAVLRRYLGGYTLFANFLTQVAEEPPGVGSLELRELLLGLAIFFDRLMSVVGEEYRRELDARGESSERRLASRVERLLGGELVDTAAFDYDFDAWHVAIVATGPRARLALRDLGAALHRRLLLVNPGTDSVWAWLGGRSPIESEDVLQAAIKSGGAEFDLAIGEPAAGLSGWRLSHRQAKAAQPIVSRGSHGIVRYADVALLAAALRDDILASSLESLYLEPLAGGKDDGAALIRTLRAYFAAGRQVSSAAAALGVSRQTVASRLRAIEERINRPLESCAAEIETALRIRELSTRKTV